MKSYFTIFHYGLQLRGYSTKGWKEEYSQILYGGLTDSSNAMRMLIGI